MIILASLHETSMRICSLHLINIKVKRNPQSRTYYVILFTNDHHTYDRVSVVISYILLHGIASSSIDKQQLMLTWTEFRSYNQC